jgi:hypothetical protein
MEQAYELGDNRPPLNGLNGKIEDQVVWAVRQEMNHFEAANRKRECWGERRLESRPEARAPPREQAQANDGHRGRSSERNRPSNQAAPIPSPPPAISPVNEPAQAEAFNGHCPRCLQRGHRVRDCRNTSAVPRNDCCGWYGKHFPGYAQATAQDRERASNGARPQGVVDVVSGSEPILPHSVEVQHNWTDAELSPHSSSKSAEQAEPAEPIFVKPSNERRQDQSNQVESELEEDDENASSEDKGEVFIRGALNKRKRGAPKEYLPKHKEPVVNPLSVEERVKCKG